MFVIYGPNALIHFYAYVSDDFWPPESHFGVALKWLYVKLQNIEYRRIHGTSLYVVFLIQFDVNGHFSFFN